MAKRSQVSSKIDWCGGNGCGSLRATEVYYCNSNGYEPADVSSLRRRTVMAIFASLHWHYCSRCWNPYECECGGGFATVPRLCRNCSNFQTDGEFLHAIGVSWDGKFPSIHAGQG